EDRGAEARLEREQRQRHRRAEAAAVERDAVDQDVAATIEVVDRPAEILAPVQQALTGGPQVLFARGIEGVVPALERSLVDRQHQGPAALDYVVGRQVGAAVGMARNPLVGERSSGGREFGTLNM